MALENRFGFIRHYFAMTAGFFSLPNCFLLAPRDFVTPLSATVCSRQSRAFKTIGNFAHIFWRCGRRDRRDITTFQVFFYLSIWTPSGKSPRIRPIMTNHQRVSSPDFCISCFAPGLSESVRKCSQPAYDFARDAGVAGGDCRHRVRQENRCSVYSHGKYHAHRLHRNFPTNYLDDAVIDSEAIKRAACFQMRPQAWLFINEK